MTWHFSLNFGDRRFDSPLWAQVGYSDWSFPDFPQPQTTFCDKVKFVPVLNQVPHNEDVLGEWRYIFTHFSLGTRRRWVISFTLRPFTQGKDPPGTHWTGGRVGARAGLDAVAKCLVARILNLGTIWRWVVSFTLRPIHSLGRNPRYPLGKRPVPSNFHDRYPRRTNSQLSSHWMPYNI